MASPDLNLLNHIGTEHRQPCIVHVVVLILQSDASYTMVVVW